jgi:hypothetical protein
MAIKVSEIGRPTTPPTCGDKADFNGETKVCVLGAGHERSPMTPTKHMSVHGDCYVWPDDYEGRHALKERARVFIGSEDICVIDGFTAKLNEIDPPSAEEIEAGVEAIADEWAPMRFHGEAAFIGPVSGVDMAEQPSETVLNQVLPMPDHPIVETIAAEAEKMAMREVDRYRRPTRFITGTIIKAEELNNTAEGDPVADWDSTSKSDPVADVESAKRAIYDECRDPTPRYRLINGMPVHGSVEEAAIGPFKPISPFYMDDPYAGLPEITKEMVDGWRALADPCCPLRASGSPIHDTWCGHWTDPAKPEIEHLNPAGFPCVEKLEALGCPSCHTTEALYCRACAVCTCCGHSPRKMVEHNWGVSVLRSALKDIRALGALPGVDAVAPERPWWVITEHDSQKEKNRKARHQNDHRDEVRRYNKRMNEHKVYETEGE